MNIINERLAAVRQLMEQRGFDALIVSSADPHGSEYVADRYQNRVWLSGFTGSAGTIIVTLNEALLWVDSRYYIQGEQQIEGTDFSLMKLDYRGTLDPISWLKKSLKKGSTVAFEYLSFSISYLRKLKEKLDSKNINFVDADSFFDEVWKERKALPFSKVKEVSVNIVGQSREEKIEAILKRIKELGCNVTIVSSLDDIAWILNLRGDDVPFNPLFMAYLIISDKETFLFTNLKRFDEKLKTTLNESITILEYDQIFKEVKNIVKEGDVVYYSPDKTSVALANTFIKTNKSVEGLDISTMLKACKNETELEMMRKVHLLDGLAIVKLLHLLDKQKQSFTEITLAEKLEQFREENKHYLGPSFGTIAGFGEHGALAHYSATKESSVELIGDNLLVLDSGGQYDFGTTDITRTLLFGKSNEQMCNDYTLVLKGNLALTKQIFPEGTNGYQLDVLARQFLWQNSLNYGHGTGHGIGFYLNVHEGPQNISQRAIPVELKEGMIISNEPGLYREGQYGIRIENLVAVKQTSKSSFGNFLGFEVLTLAPFERKLINKNLLTNEEIEMVDAYHNWVYLTLKEHLADEVATFLKEATLPL